MASIQIVAQNTLYAVTLECLFTPLPGIDDDAVALARAVAVALNTDRRALADDVLPQPTEPNQMPDLRGWWGDLDAGTIWGGWPIGIRLWLMQRDKITDAASKQGATIEKARRFIAEALQPFVDARICSSFKTDLRQASMNSITGRITIFRGPKTAIALQYQALWADIEA